MVNMVVVYGVIGEEPTEVISRNNVRIVSSKLSIETKGKFHSLEIKCFGDTASSLACLVVGTPVIIQGRLDVSEWEYMGKQYSKIALVTTDITVVGRAAEDPWEV